MDPPQTFSSGPELANFVISSGVLNQSLATVQDLHGEKINQNEHPERGDLVSSSTLEESFPLFNFLCTKNNPDFTINKAALVPSLLEI
uniref:Uncharacterized protein n=1 Tax=Quercus lobata TaxID=97700 RepID=A0A7N2N7Y4_QUELO